MRRNIGTEATNRCKCCLEEDDLKDIWKEHDNEGEQEIYGDMIRDCFVVPWYPPNNKSEYICNSCIIRLRVAVSFKKGMLVSEQTLKEYFDEESEAIVKLEEESDVDIETEYLSIEYLEDEDSLDDVKKEIKIEVNESDTKVSTYKTKDKYTQEDLNKCLEAVRSKMMTQVEASVIYDIPRRVISETLSRTHCTVSKIQNKPRPANKDIFISKMFPELTNFGKDLGVILEFSNATPINYHRGFSYKCCYCSSEFKDPTDLKQHTIDCHDEKTRSGLIQGNYSASYAVKLDVTDLLCTVCDKSIESLNELIDHLNAAHEKTIHEKIKNYILPFKFDGDELRCVVCESVFYKMKFLQEHMNVHYRNFICDHCDSGFVARTILVGHIKRHAVGCFKCVFCSKPFDTAQKKHLHERVVHYRVLKKCIHCVRMFSTYEKREEHLVQEHGHRSVTFSCQSCDKVFSTNRHLKKHIKRDHLLERRHQCKECDMTFFRGVELKQHMVKHTGIKEFECHICHKSYVRIGTLRVHMSHSHGSSVDPTHESGFECEQCGQTFAQRCAFRGHMRTQHHRNIST